MTAPVDDLFMARLCEWATITRPQSQGEVDVQAVQQLVSTVYGGDWLVGAGTGRARKDDAFHLPYLCVSSQANKCAVLVFKGSDRLFHGLSYPDADAARDYATSVLGAGKAPYTGYPAQLHLDDNDMYVHSGWQDAWSSMRTDVFHLVPDAASAGQDGWSLFIVGHSLGGALAQYCFVDSLTKQLLTELRCSKITCRTFGAPLIGNAKFWLALDALMEALFDHSALIVDVAFYEAEHEVFGTFNQRYVSLFTLSKLLGYDASPYAKPLPITTADWAIDARVHRVQLTHHIATYITYFSTISNTPPRPIRKIEDAKNWVVAFLVIDGGDPAAGQADFVAMLYPVQGTPGRSSLFNAALQVPDGASVVIGGSRPADWNVNDLTLRSDPRNPHAVSVGTLVMYLDDLECLRIEDVMFPAGEAGVRSVTLSGFSGGG